MGLQIPINNSEFLFSENMEIFIRSEYPDVKLEVSHALNQLEIKNKKFNTEIKIDKDAQIIEVNSAVNGTGVKLWLFVILALPYRMLDKYQVIDFHIMIEIIYYALAFFLATLPGRIEARDWETVRKNKEKEIRDLIEKSNVAVGKST